MVCNYSELVCGGRTPQLKMECYNLQLNFLAVVFTTQCKNSTLHFYKCHDVFLCTSVGDLHDKNGVTKIVGWTFGSVGVLS